MISALFAGELKPRWREADIIQALPRAGREIHCGRSLFLILEHAEGDVPADERATIVATPGPDVLVLGNTSLAAWIRRRLVTPDNPSRLTLRALPGPELPLDRLTRCLSARTAALLRRTGFSTVEEVAAVPAETWNRLPQIGAKRCEELIYALTQLTRGTPDPAEI